MYAVMKNMYKNGSLKKCLGSGPENVTVTRSAQHAHS